MTRNHFIQLKSRYNDELAGSEKRTVREIAAAGTKIRTRKESSDTGEREREEEERIA